MNDKEDNKNVTSQKNLPPYRLIQLEWDSKKGFHNEAVASFDELVTHHPKANGRAKLEDGLVIGGEDTRRHAVINGKIQEIEISRPGRDFDLNPGQILMKKDFILEDSRIPSGYRSRNVDVPSPVSGYIGRVIERQGLVDIYDRRGGEVVARIRHMGPIDVREGQTVEYGQSLGVQNEIGLTPGSGKHVHLEMDTRYYQQYENYVSDLINGRLSIDPDRQTYGIPPLPILDDGTFRIGESNPRIRQFQEVLISGGYHGAHKAALQNDGVYRLEMQPAVLAFQQGHGLAKTGDIDRSTLHVALPHSRHEAIDRMDHVERNRAPFAPTREPDEPARGFRPGPEDYRQQHNRPHPQANQTSNELKPGHPDYALFAAIRQHLPDKYSDDMAAHVMLQAKIGGVWNVDELDKVIVRDDRVFVMGTTPGFRADVYLSQTPPSMQETTQRLEDFDKQRTQQHEQWMAQEQQQSQDRGMRYSL